MKNKYMVWLLGLGLILSIISIGVVARKSLAIHEHDSIPIISQNNIYSNTYNLRSYLIPLQNYLSTSDVKLSVENNFKKEHILQKLMIIANLEKKNDIQQMSVDGREIAISLIKNIYEVYGVDIIFGMSGEIQNIKDKLGNIIYQNADDKEMKIEIQLVYLTIVVCIILMLLGLSILITRKSKILKKGGDFDGLDEKKYA